MNKTALENIISKVGRLEMLRSLVQLEEPAFLERSTLIKWSPNNKESKEYFLPEGYEDTDLSRIEKAELRRLLLAWEIRRVRQLKEAHGYYEED